jgi:hypothetical protein
MTDRRPPMTDPTGAPVVVDCVIVGGHVMDPATGLDELADIAVDNGRIVAVETAKAGGLGELDTKRRIDASGKIVCPGLIDIHTHVYEWVTNFGVNADDAGVGVGQLPSSTREVPARGPSRASNGPSRRPPQTFEPLSRLPSRAHSLVVAEARLFKDRL